MRILLFFSIIFCQFACNKCQSIDCPTNTIGVKFVDNTGREILIPSAAPPKVTFNINGQENPSLATQTIHNNSLVVSQEFRNGIAIIDFQSKKDTITLLNPKLNREDQCCKLAFADSVLINGRLRALANNVIITR